MEALQRREAEPLDARELQQHVALAIELGHRCGLSPPTTRSTCAAARGIRIQRHERRTDRLSHRLHRRHGLVNALEGQRGLALDQHLERAVARGPLSTLNTPLSIPGCTTWQRASGRRRRSASRSQWDDRDVIERQRQGRLRRYLLERRVPVVEALFEALEQERAARGVEFPERGDGLPPGRDGHVVRPLRLIERVECDQLRLDPVVAAQPARVGGRDGRAPGRAPIGQHEADLHGAERMPPASTMLGTGSAPRL